jgi:hypothetical protein
MGEIEVANFEDGDSILFGHAGYDMKIEISKKKKINYS